MKVKVRERVLLAVYALLGIAGAAALVLLAVFRDSFQFTIMGYTLSLRDGVWTLVILYALAAILLAWSVKVIMLAFRREPKVDKSSVSVQNTENGSVRVSVQAMDTLVKQAIGHQEGVADIHTSIVNHEDSITVKIEMTLMSDVHIPNITMLMQRSIKNYIEEYSGIAVREVVVLVSSILEVTPAPPLAIEGQVEKAPEAVVDSVLQEEPARAEDPRAEDEPAAAEEPALDAEREAEVGGEPVAEDAPEADAMVDDIEAEAADEARDEAADEEAAPPAGEGQKDEDEPEEEDHERSLW